MNLSLQSCKHIQRSHKGTGSQQSVGWGRAGKSFGQKKEGKYIFREVLGQFKFGRESPGFLGH